MKCIISLIVYMLAILMAYSAEASDGKISFKGLVTQKTCTVSVNGVVSPVAATITLPTVSASILDAPGKTAGGTNFEIQLRDCVHVFWFQSIMAYFEAGADVDPISGELINRGDAANVRLQLRDRAGPIKVGDLESQEELSQWWRMYDDGTTSRVRLSVQYKATGVATIGSVVSTVTYSIHYL